MQVKGAGRRFKLIIFNLVKDHNVGMLIRSAYAFGCDEVIVVGRKRFKFTGSSGTYKYQSIRHFFSMPEARDYCLEQGFKLYGIEIGGEPVGECAFDEDVALILGNEGRGLSDAEPFCDRIVTIPQWGGVPSLNVAVAGSIVMYEFQRRQQHPQAQHVGQKFVDEHYQIG